MLLATAAVFASLVFAGWSFYQGKQDLCHGRDVGLNVLQAILLDAREQAAASPVRTKDTITAIRFYDRQLARVEQARC